MVKKLKLMDGKCPLCNKYYSDLMTHLYYGLCESDDTDAVNDLYARCRRQMDRRVK